MSMFGDGSPKEVIWDALRQLESEGYSQAEIGQMTAQVLSVWLGEWEYRNALSQEIPGK